MSDAVLPTPRSSSGAPDGNKSDSSSFETDHDISLFTSSGSESKEETFSRSEPKGDGKQKRKRTRYVLETCRLLLLQNIAYSRNSTFSTSFK